MAEFRHVVSFRWTADSSADQRAAAVAALEGLARDVADLGRLTVGVDAGVSDGNADAVVVVDFAERADYLAYATDPRHVAVVTEHIRPILAERVAVQHEL